MSSRVLTPHALWIGLFFACCGCRKSAPAPRSVILVSCDTLRADRLGTYGCPRGTSPHLDALARESRVYESAWSTAPLTGPSLSALLTGRLPEELGLEDNRFVLAAEAETLAERISAAGIDTAAVVSNWVLRRRPELPGAGVQQGFAHFDDRMDTAEPSRPDLKERRADRTTDAALAWLDAEPAERSFFLWVHYQDPHGPYTPPADCVVPIPAETPPKAPLEVGPDQRGQGVLPSYQVVDEERRPEVYRARYEGEIRYFDRELGRLLDELRRRGVLEHALLIFTADHGEALGEHGTFFAHGHNLHQELVHVPLLVRPPGREGVEARIDAPASHLDLFPTVLTALGIDPGPTRGVDLLGAPLSPERVLPQYLRGGWSATGAHRRLLVEQGQRQLFDLRSDPAEEHDLSSSEPALVRSLAEAHRAFVGRLALAPLAAARPPDDAAGRREMDALGYGGERESGH